MLKNRRRSNSELFQGFCFLTAAENDLKMKCQNVKLFLREPFSKKKPTATMTIGFLGGKSKEI